MKTGAGGRLHIGVSSRIAWQHNSRECASPHDGTLWSIGGHCHGAKISWLCSLYLYVYSTFRCLLCIIKRLKLMEKRKLIFFLLIPCRLAFGDFLGLFSHSNNHQAFVRADRTAFSNYDSTYTYCILSIIYLFAPFPY